MLDTKHMTCWRALWGACNAMHCQVHLDMIATQWLLSMYVNALPTETVLR